MDIFCDFPTVLTLTGIKLAYAKNVIGVVLWYSANCKTTVKLSSSRVLGVQTIELAKSQQNPNNIIVYIIFFMVIFITIISTSVIKSFARWTKRGLDLKKILFMQIDESSISCGVLERAWKNAVLAKNAANFHHHQKYRVLFRKLAPPSSQISNYCW